MPHMRKRSAKITNVRFRKKDPSVAPYWPWIMHQDNLKLSVLSAIQMAQDRLGNGDLRTSLISLAENSIMNGKPVSTAPVRTQPRVQSSQPHQPISRPRTQPKPKAKPEPKSKPSINDDSPLISNGSSGHNDGFSAIKQNLHPHRK